jgi:antitoxin FitA
MGELLVRQVPDHIIAALDRRARLHKKSREDEHRALLQELLAADTVDVVEEAKAMREQTKGRITVSSEDLVQQARDSR